MSIFFPDVSNYQQGFSLADYPAAIAKATEGTTFTDVSYRNFKAQAAALRIPFAAYHWLNTADLQAQAEHAYAVAGSVPLMWDCEADGATVPRILEITARYRKLGGTATLVYLPRWWWRDHLGSPDLRPLEQAGLALISSAYPSGGYSDNGIGWASYGGVTPTIWQYTSTPHDMNAFKGTADELAAVFAGEGDDVTELEHNWLYNLGSITRALADGAGECDQVTPETSAHYTLSLAPYWARVGAELTPEQLAAVAGAAHNGAAGAIDGATISSATISTAG